MFGLVKKSNDNGLPLQIILSICLLLFATPVYAAEIIMVADEWPPYCGKAGSTFPGYGVEIGRELNAYFDKNAQRVQYVSGIDPLSMNIRKLLAGRFDTLIAGENVMTYKIKEMGVVGEVINVGVTDISANLYIAFSPTNKNSGKYADIFSKGIRKLKKSGELDQILDRYELHYWK